MRFRHVSIDSVAVELPDEVWSSELIETKLAPLYTRLRLHTGRLELMTGIRERRFWSRAVRPSEAAALAVRKALAQAGVGAGEIDLLIYAGVCRDRLEPSTAAYVHGLIGAAGGAQILDVSNACLGFLNGVVLAGGLVESGQVRRALICAGENGRPLVERTIEILNSGGHDRDGVKPYFANLTIGAGAAAAVVCRDTLARVGALRLLGGVAMTDSSANTLCEGGDDGGNGLTMQTDSERLLEAGVALAERAWGAFCDELGWGAATPARVITHQVGRRHSQLLFERLGLAPEKDWRTFDRLGNTGSVSLPTALALARDAGAVSAGDAVALLGIGSGLGTLMLGVRCE
ncbi:MAG: 3-oxoacyl-ACP synthase III [Puniceicoccales bacterium]|jgi:3-oxoacyl-[acyl-carrier-protein] synthase-3|nr:3-oxoacyl-ACP synthase III [Puniceicoccales bacterium]